MHSQGLRSSLRFFSNHKSLSRCQFRGKATESLKQGDALSGAGLASEKVNSQAVTKASLSILQSLIAIGAAMGTVSAAAFIIEQATADDVRDFDLQGDRFDQNTFMGRFSKMILGCDPRLLLYSLDDVQRSTTMVKNAGDLIAFPPEGVKNIHRSLWEAYRISSASLNGDEYIPFPFRMSGTFLV